MSNATTAPSSQGSSLRYDPEYQAFLDSQADKKNDELTSKKTQNLSILELRTINEPFLPALFPAEPYPPSVTQIEYTVQVLASSSNNGSNPTTVTVTRFTLPSHLTAANPSSLRPAVVYLHGGGAFSGSVSIYAGFLARMVAATGVQFFAVEYPLAPEHPAPAGVEASYAALKWLSDCALVGSGSGSSGATHDFGIDPARIAIMGDSGGGLVAAGTALMARDRRLNPPLAKQILVYPMLDDRTRYPDDAEIQKYFLWPDVWNRIAWRAYMGGDKAEEEISAYAVPARAVSVAGLPPTYIDVGTLDLFRDEDVRYATRLMQADVEVELHVYPGVPHGFEIAKDIGVTARAFENRIRAVKSF